MAIEGPAGDENVRRRRRHGLAPLLRVGTVAEPAWGEGDWAAMLRHQLAAALPPDVGKHTAALSRESATGGRSAPPLNGTFGELLHHPHPAPDALALVKDFTKAAKDDLDGPLPAEVAAVLYYASILVARARCGRRISALPDDALRRGAERVLAGAWVDARTRSLLVAGLAFLNGPDDRVES